MHKSPPQTQLRIVKAKLSLATSPLQQATDEIDLDNIPDVVSPIYQNNFQNTGGKSKNSQFQNQIAIKQTKSRDRISLVKFKNQEAKSSGSEEIQQIQICNKLVHFNIENEKQASNKSHFESINQENQIKCQQKFESFRTLINKAIKSEYYRYWYILVLSAFTSALLIYDFDPNQSNPNATYNGDAVLASFYIELFCQIFFTFHLLVTFIEFKSLEIEWTVLDVITTSCGLVALFLAQQKFDLVAGTTITAKNFLKAIRVLKMLFFVKLWDIIRMPANNVLNSLKSVGKILIPALFIIYMYAVVGLYSFSDYEYNRCRPDNVTDLTQNWTVYSSEIYLCGQRKCPSSYSCLNPVDYGVIPDSNELLKIELGNSLMTYQNILYACLSTVKQIFGTGSSRLIILQKQTLNYLYILTYYLSFIYLLSYIYLNIFYGLMMSNEGLNIDCNQATNGIVSNSVQNSKALMNHTGGFKDQKHKNQKMDRKKSIFKQQTKQKVQKNIFENDHISEVNQQEPEAVTPKKIPNFSTSNNQVDEQQSMKLPVFNSQQQNISIPDQDYIKQQISPDLIRPLPFIKQPQSSQGRSEQSYDKSSSNSQLQQKKLISWQNAQWIYTSINHLLILAGFINLTFEFQGQSSEFQFIVDSIDMAIYGLFLLFCIIDILIYVFKLRQYNKAIQKIDKNIGKQSKLQQEQHNQSAQGLKIKINKSNDPMNRIDIIKTGMLNESMAQAEQQQNVQEINFSDQLPQKPVIYPAFYLEIVLLVICSVGVIYEAVIADSLATFLVAQDKISNLLRCFKYLRVIVIFVSDRYFEQSRIIVKSIFVTIYKLRNFIIFWMVIMIIFSIMGFHLFAYRTEINHRTGSLDFQRGEPFPVSHNGMFSSVIFTMLTFYNEQWDFWMFQQYLGSGALIVIWQLLSLCIGLIVMSKYFMALLMKELGEQLDKVEQENMSEEKRQEKRQRSIKISQQVTGKKVSIQNLKDNLVIPIQESSRKESSKKLQDDRHDVKRQIQSGSVFELYKKESNQGSKAKYLRRASTLAQEINAESIMKDSVSPVQKQNQGLSEDQEVSFGVTLSFKIVRIFKIVMEHRAYTIIRILVILMSVVDLVFRHPQILPSSTTFLVLQVFDYIVVVFFLIETLVILISYGLFRGPTSYLRKSWINWINLVIIVIEVLSHVVLTDNQLISKLTTVKVLRVLYLIEMRYEADRNMRLTVVGFRRLVPRILTLLGVTLIFYGFFALILVNLYKNDFYYCNGVNLTTSQMTLTSQTQTKSVIILNSSECLFWGGDWIQYRINVSNYLNALLFSLLSVTTEGWTSLSIPLASLRGQGLQPITNSNPIFWVFTVIFFFFGNMIMLNVFVGLTMNNFKKIKEEVTGEANLLNVQKEWLSIKKQIYRLQPQILDKPPQQPVRNICYAIVNSNPYNILKIILFLAFIVSMSLFTTNMSIEYFNALIIVKFCFVGLQAVFYTLQTLAYGVRSDNLRQFIFQTALLVYASIYGILLLSVDVSKQNKKIFGGILIALLLVDYFEILMEFQFVKKMMNSLISILPQTSNLLIIILCTLFIYTIVGMELFSYLKTNVQLNSFDQNYRNFQTALFSLVKFSLMEAPIDQLSDAAQQIGPNFVCYDILSYQDFVTYGQMGCGSKAASYIFFLSFHIIYSLILMSTMIAIIFDAYSQVRTEEQAMVNKFQLLEVKQLWKGYDPDATGYISYRDFWMFTAKLVKIYRVDNDKILNSDTKQNFLQSLAIPIYEHPSGILCFQFHQVIQALTKLVFNRKNGQGKTKNADKMFNQNENTFTGEKLKRSHYNSAHVLTLIILKSGLRVWRKKTKGEQVDQAMSLFATAKIKQKIHHEKQMQQKQQRQKEQQQIRRKRRRNATVDPLEQQQSNKQAKEQVSNENRLNSEEQKEISFNAQKQDGRQGFDSK